MKLLTSITRSAALPLLWALRAAADNTPVNAYLSFTSNSVQVL